MEFIAFLKILLEYDKKSLIFGKRLKIEEFIAFLKILLEFDKKSLNFWKATEK